MGLSFKYIARNYVQLRQVLVSYIHCKVFHVNNFAMDAQGDRQELAQYSVLLLELVCKAPCSHVAVQR
jgi:hypothetical protein